jgi:hypothetical protein
MEDVMPKSAERSAGPGLRDAADRFLARWREWWQRGRELGNFDRPELDRLAGELGLTAGDLEDLVARGPAAADLLYQRLSALGLTRADVERVAHGLMRDLERTCACCNEKGVCEKDLARRPEDPAWKGYCPNAISLESVKGRFPA